MCSTIFGEFLLHLDGDKHGFNRFLGILDYTTLHNVQILDTSYLHNKVSEPGAEYQYSTPIPLHNVQILDTSYLHNKIREPGTEYQYSITIKWIVLKLFVYKGWQLTYVWRDVSN